jgi:hypothetical protein
MPARVRPFRQLVAPLIRFASRLAGRESAWERVALPVPPRAFGSGSELPFAQYFEGPSSVRIASIDAMVEWLQACEYVSDVELFQKPDVWQHPGVFESRRRGDCEDFALWAWRKLAELGIDADFCVGQLIRSEVAFQHAWVVYRIDGTSFLFEPAARTPAAMIRLLDDAMDQYVPHFAVNHRFETNAFAGISL